MLHWNVESACSEFPYFIVQLFEQFVVGQNLYLPNVVEDFLSGLVIKIIKEFHRFRKKLYFEFAFKIMYSREIMYCRAIVSRANVGNHRGNTTPF